MKLYILMLLVVLISVPLCFGQEPAIRIYDFSGGLNTKAGLFGVRANQAIECLNIDLSEKYGGIRPRKGFVTLTDSLPQATPIYGLYGYTSRVGGEKKLFAITDQVDTSLTGLGYLVRSPAYDYELDIDSGADSLYPYMYTGAPWYWTTWQNDVFVSCGRQVPLVVHNSFARDLIVQAPGEPRIYPMNDTAVTGHGTPNGEYRYLVRLRTRGSSLYKSSYLTHPVKALDEKIMLANFTSRTIDSIADTSSSFWDSLTLNIFRCTANVESYTGALTMWRVFEGNFYPDDGDWGDSVLDTLRFIDSIPDDSLGSGSYTTTTVPDFNKQGRASDLVLQAFRCGAPTYIGRNVDTAQDKISLPKDTSGNIDTTITCMVYMLTYTDTITGYESDSGRNLFIFIQHDTGAVDTVFDSNFVIGIPPIPSGRDHLARNLYKAFGFTFARDSMGGNVVVGWDTVFATKWDFAEGTKAPIRSRFREPKTDTIITALYSLDTNISAFYRLATITDSSIKSFTDTMSWDSMVAQRDVYYKSGAPVALNYVSTFGDRAWGSDGSLLYYSYLDSGGYWSVFDGIALNLDDGDEGTAVVPYRDHIKYFKNKAQFILFTDDGINYNRKWVVDGIGCIAPASMTSYNNGLVYLSEHGVIYETGLIYKDKGSSFDIISTPISDLLDYTPDQHRTAVGTIKDNKYWLSYPEKDTTYVYDFIIGAWSIYSFAFTQSTFYDTVHSDNIRPAKDMLFIISSSDRVFKADTGTFDITGSDTAAIPVEWKSGALAISRISKGVATVGLYCNPDMKDSVVTVLLYDAEGTQKDSATVTVQTSYTAQDMAEKELLNYFNIKLSNVDGSDTLATFKIDGIEVWPEDKGPSDKE